MSDLAAAISLARRRYEHDPRRATVMVSYDTPSEYKRRHVRLYADRGIGCGALYVRLGKRGRIKLYLTDMVGARIVNDEHAIVVFHED